MPFLIVDGERRALRPGRNVLGGRGADAIELAPLAALPAAAVLTVRPDGSAIIQRIAAAVIVKVDNGPLGAMPHPIIHGARLAVGPVRLTYEDLAEKRDKATLQIEHDNAPPTEVVPVLASSHASGRLIELATGCVYPIGHAGLVIGRGASCDIPLEGTGVSRRHAVVKPDGPSFVVSDESANGTFVNGKRIQGTVTLRHGDVLGIDTDEFRLDIHAALGSAFGEVSDGSEMVGGIMDPDPLGLAPRRPAPVLRPTAPSPLATAPTAQPLAMLETMRGPLGGKVFRVERPVCAIGRGDHNEIRLNDGSVSASHATLLLKRGTWYVVDLQSANGTYVDGYRVATERAIADGGTVRVGDVNLRFKLVSTAREASNVTHGGGGIWRKLTKFFQA